MLVITRNACHEILKRRVRLTLPDGRHCWLTLLDVECGKARLGFECPPDVTISREELLSPGDRRDAR
jgi:sRNA-binding carbon storage regulator CsrA